MTTSPPSRSSSSTDVLEIGRITRPHGVRGEVGVLLTSNRTERLDPGSVLDTANGPLEVRSSRPHKGNWLVQFIGVTDRDGAEALRDTVLRAEPIDDPDELWVHDLIGSTVIDQDGVVHGHVVRVLDNPASDLLELDGGALVPVQFVVDHTPGEEIRVDTPVGLFDLDKAASERDQDET
ncbi:MAG: ribosome maturation factor RimM [Acidimicrobiales bacterium]|nr:ribosome maturation factor RimM [Acidimicrobiales bacterium]